MNKLIFGDIEVSKKQSYESKKAVKLSEADVNKIVVSNKIKGNYETSKVFIDYMDDISGFVKPLRPVKFLMVIWMILVVLLRLYVLFYHK